MPDLGRRATYQDVLDAPPNYLAEIIHGVLHTLPRPAMPYRNVASVLAGELYLPFRRGLGGPGNWAFIDEPELHLGGDPDIVIPDIAGWRRERMQRLPMKDAAIFLPPDWVCEVLSPATEALDRSEKMDIYARESVKHLWLVDPRTETLEVYRIDGAASAEPRSAKSSALVEPRPAPGAASRWTRIGAWRGRATLRVEPFEAAELELGVLWED